MNTTILFIVIIVVVITIFDVVIIAKKGKHESVSAHIIRGSKQYPLLVLIFGIVLGHLFWSMNTADVYNNVECVKVVE